MITKIANKLEELGYIDSWRGKLNAAKDVPASYVAANSLAGALHGGTVSLGGTLLTSLIPRRGMPLAARLRSAARAGAIAVPATALTAAAYSAAEAPIEYAYTKGFMPSANPLKSMLGYVQVPNFVKKKYVRPAE